MQGSNGHGDKLAFKREAAIAALLTQPTIIKAAEVVGVDHSTLRRWLRDDSFVAEFKGAQRSIRQAAEGRLQELQTKALETLDAQLACEVPAVAVRAAQIILDHARSTAELDELRDELAKVRVELADLKARNVPAHAQERNGTAPPGAGHPAPGE